MDMDDVLSVLPPVAGPDFVSSHTPLALVCLAWLQRPACLRHISPTVVNSFIDLEP